MATAAARWPRWLSSAPMKCPNRLRSRARSKSCGVSFDVNRGPAQGPDARNEGALETDNPQASAAETARSLNEWKLIFTDLQAGHDDVSMLAGLVKTASLLPRHITAGAFRSRARTTTSLEGAFSRRVGG